MRPTPFGMRNLLQAAALAIALGTAAGAADFDLGATIRAGRINGSDWELGIGSSINSTPIHSRVANPYYPNGTPNRFEIGYTSATNTAYLRYYYSASNYRQVLFAPGGPGLGAYSVWTIPTGSLFVEATSRPTPTSITISGLTLGGGVQVLQPFSSTTLTASQNRTDSLVGSTAPVQFRTSASGNWLVSGSIAFAGLRAYVNGGAVGEQLRMGAEFYGTSASTPEPRVAGLIASGLVLLAALDRLRRRCKGELCASKIPPTPFQQTP